MDLGTTTGEHGRPGEERNVSGEARILTDKQRVSYDWGRGIEEWWVNEARGLEHGFTIAERPSEESGRVVLRLSVRGTLRARADGNGFALGFLNAAGAAAVNYAGLRVWDADGRACPARMNGHASGVTIEMGDRGARYPLTADPTAQQAYLKASNTGAGDQFGGSVAVSGDTVVVGASQESSTATGVYGNQSDNSAFWSGTAYVFVPNGGAWTQQAYLKASNTTSSDLFGCSVAASGDTVVAERIVSSSLAGSGGGILLPGGLCVCSERRGVEPAGLHQRLKQR